MSERESSPWLYVGVGCLLAVILVVGSCVAVGWLGVRKAKELGEDITDPVKREAKVLEILGAEELPPGYYPMMALSMPLGVMEMAMLTDQPPREDEEGRSVPAELGARGLIYVSQRDFGGNRSELSAYLRGKGKSRGPLENLHTDVDFDERRFLARGELEVDDVAVLYASYEGDVGMHGHPDVDAVTTLFQPLCPEASRVQTGIWWVPVRERDGAEDERDVGASGRRDVEREADASRAEATDEAPTPPSPEELAAFLSFFELCG